ncbi:unnamed protein product [Linum trigynum]|uniref:Endoglucanase n=1 Tax=Linum trigynum TaxID=586398 RepID=A0AAV2DJD2_9ROSI
MDLSFKPLRNQKAHPGLRTSQQFLFGLQSLYCKKSRQETFSLKSDCKPLISSFQVVHFEFMVALISSFQVAHFNSNPPQQNLRRNLLQHHRRTSLIRCGIAEASGQPAPVGQKTKYNDGLFEKLFMTLFARKMEKFGAPAKAGDAGKEKGWLDYNYESFVDASKKVMQGRNRIQQQQVVRQVLLSMLPPGAPEQFRKLFPPTRWAEEFNAALTVPFFQWLVGPSEVIEVEVNGVKQRSGVLIKKCRYLENSGCVGMCVNMCKIPTQDFFTNEFGLPLTMNPNFEDMSCEMIYGQAPPAFEDDPVAKQPCFANICGTRSILFCSPTQFCESARDKISSCNSTTTDAESLDKGSHPCIADVQLDAFTPQDYADALDKSILFFEGQRSGKLPADQRLTWRADSGLSDGSTYHVNLVGGYYDAGDNVKFGLPMAFTTTLLSWSVIEFGSSMGNQIHNAKSAIRWSTDYLLKAATATPDTLYVQVGDPNMDHRCWERPEDMDTPRTVYKVTAQNPGSDVAAETAAALAAASIVFRDSDPHYSSKLLGTAMKVFSFADRYRGSYSESLSSAVCPFYCSYSGYHDELLWGASWLHRASQNASYLNYIQSNGHTLGAEDDDYSFSWDDKRPGTKVLLSKGFLESSQPEFLTFKSHSDNYICSLIPGSSSFQAQYTPGGLLYKGSESNLQYVTSTTFLLLTYAKYLSSNGGETSCGGTTVTAESLVAQAKKQVDYILGDNPQKMSYMVGFGDKFPQHVHHRGSSVPCVKSHPARIPCGDGFQYLYSGSPNPNVLVGAILGGPDSRDEFADARSNYQQSEPATYINAPFVGAVAFFAAATT